MFYLFYGIPASHKKRPKKRAKVFAGCRKISNVIQHTRNVATAQNYNSRKFGLKMYFFKIQRIRFR